MNSALSVGESILLTGSDLKGVFRYHEKSNRFEKVLELDCVRDKKLLYTLRGEIVCMVKGEGIYVCKEDNIREWKEVGRCEDIAVTSTSVSQEWKGFIYFINREY